jgi:chaperone BCS1
VYTFSLKEVHCQTELRQLFSAPCKGDVLLLEDVDTADIWREEMPIQAPESIEHDRDSTDDEPKHRKRRTGITLAGLLNAMDTAREGDVLLIISTNRPETLDAALSRAGRIARETLFGKGFKDIMKKIFQRIYKDQTGEADFNDLANRSKIETPEYEFTAAKMQGFLIAHRTPGAAVKHNAAWVEAEGMKRNPHQRQGSSRECE